MERPAKRPRLFAPLDSVYHSGFGNQHAYYENHYEVARNTVDQLKEYEEPAEKENEPVYDPDEDLERKRAQVDFKLKSTFEAIFEKYGKDFEGIGDEIDMATGEVVVNNGHILRMRDEMDAGEESWSEEDLDDTTGSDEDDVMEGQDEDEDQEDSDEEDYNDEDALSDGDMDEDDMILRGFAQASQQFMHRQQPQDPISSRDRLAVQVETQSNQPFLHQQRSQDPGPSRDQSVVQPGCRYSAVSRPGFSGSVLPSRSEILAQFGPQLGPEIVKYVSKKKSLEDSHVEPAWRVPNIVPEAHAPPARRPFIKSMVPPPDPEPEPEPERSPSPENAPSIWAVKAPKIPRKRFSKAEDEMLLDFVANTRRQCLSLSSNLTWRKLEAMAPRHDWRAWKGHYVRKFTYLQSGPRDDADLSTSETSASTGQIHGKHLGYSTSAVAGKMHERQLGFASSFTQPAPPHLSRPVDTQRPARSRKPAQRDGIVSWSEAVATIAAVDPIGNAGLLDDARRAAGYSFESGQRVSSSFASFSAPRHSQDKHSIKSRQPLEQDPHRRVPPEADRPKTLNSEGDELASDESMAHNERNMTEEVLCPHVDCRPYPTTLYRLERRHGEDLSPLCSHLLCVHRIAPFSCVEPECEHRGARGYFMQIDLVRHVKEAHPYIAALHRLRGRVAPALLSQAYNYEQLHGSENLRSDISGQQLRDSDFMSLRRSYTSHGPLNGQRVSPASNHDPDKTLARRAGFRTLSDGVPSMHVHPSSTIVKDMLSKANFRAPSSDSDVQMLDQNPLLTRTAQTEQPHKPDLVTATASSKREEPRLQGPTPVSPPRSKSAIPCTYPGCQIIISHIGDMFAHLRTHDTRSKSPPPPTGMNFTSEAHLLSTIPDSQSSATATQLSQPFLSMRGESSHSPRVLKSPTPGLDTFVDRSYDFSDEEEGIRPVIRTPPQQPVLVENSAPLPQSFFAPSPQIKLPQSAVRPRVSSSLPRNGTSPRIKSSPQSVMLHRSPLTLPENSPSPNAKPSQSKALPKSTSNTPRKGPSPRSKQPFTPGARVGLRKSIVGKVFDSEDFDELSMNENGFILLSARPRSGPLVNSTLQIRVKSEQPEFQVAPMSAITSKKQKLSMLLVDDEVDELGEDGPSPPYHLAPISSSKARHKTITREHNLHSNRAAKKSKPRKALGGSVNTHLGASVNAESVQTPTKHNLPPRTSTPLMDLVKHGQRKRKAEWSNEEIPSTSEMGSSSNTYGARTEEQRDAERRSSNLQVLVTPLKKTWAEKAVKEEEGDVVVTPRGTLRHCGHDGFVCGRSFCFNCSSEGGQAAEITMTEY